MRAVLAIVVLGLALWRAAIDWQATIGKGYAFRPSSLGQAIARAWPEGYANLVDALKRSGVPFAWDPVGAFVMALPLALAARGDRLAHLDHPPAALGAPALDSPYGFLYMTTCRDCMRLRRPAI